MVPSTHVLTATPADKPNPLRRQGMYLRRSNHSTDTSTSRSALDRIALDMGFHLLTACCVLQIMGGRAFLEHLKLVGSAVVAAVVAALA